MTERDVHLLLSQKAAKMIDQLIEYGGQYMDGCALEYVDDPDGDMNKIMRAIRDDISDQIEKPKKKGAKKRGK